MKRSEGYSHAQSQKLFLQTKCSYINISVERIETSCVHLVIVAQSITISIRVGWIGIVVDVLLLVAQALVVGISQSCIAALAVDHLNVVAQA